MNRAIKAAAFLAVAYLFVVHPALQVLEAAFNQIILYR